MTSNQKSLTTETWEPIFKNTTESIMKMFPPNIQLLDEMPHENIGDSLHLHGKMDALINQGVNKFKVFEQNYDSYHS